MHDKDKASVNKEKKIDVPSTKEKPTTISVCETSKDPSKNGKPTTVMSMLKNARDAKILNKSSERVKRSKSPSSATSDDSSTSDSDSSETSSDADPNRISDDDEIKNVNNKCSENKAMDIVSAPSIMNNIQMNGTSTSNNIPQDADKKFLENLATSHRDLINQLIDISKYPNDNSFSSPALDLLYQYAFK